MKKLGKIMVKCEVDYDNDVSYIGKYTDELKPGNIIVLKGQFVEDVPEDDLPGKSNEYRAFESATAQGLPVGSLDFRTNTLADFRQMQAIERGDIGFVSIGVEAEIFTSKNKGGSWLINTIHSGFLYGIETNSDESYLQDIANEQRMELKMVLYELGFSDTEIDAAEIVYPKGLIFNLEPKP